MYYLSPIIRFTMLNLLLLSLAQAVELFTHPIAPDYKLQVNEPKSLGVDTVRQYSGYVETPANNNLFYWFFESRNDPENDPTMLWLNGGPGCSSMESVLFEHGPANLDSVGHLHSNPWSWNNNMNMLYLDQPARVGFSTGSEIDTTVDATADFTAFVRLFFQKYPRYAQSNAFHLAGESYAGRYIPVFAEAMLQDQQSNVNLSSIVLGDGAVSEKLAYKSYQPMLCGQGGYQQVASSMQCRLMSAAMGSCQQSIEDCTQGSNAACDRTRITCEPINSALSGRNPYDIRDSSCAQSQQGLCYPQLDVVAEWFNDPQHKESLGANPDVNYAICSNAMNAQFNRRHDRYQESIQNVTNILSQRVPVLAYHGDKDIILNWLMGRDWTSSVEWAGQSGFQMAIERPTDWYQNGTLLGSVSNYDFFTFFKVSNAGHMVPHDQPEAAWRMIDAWVSGDFSFRSHGANGQTNANDPHSPGAPTVSGRTIQRTTSPTDSLTYSIDNTWTPSIISTNNASVYTGIEAQTNSEDVITVTTHPQAFVTVTETNVWGSSTVNTVTLSK